MRDMEEWEIAELRAERERRQRTVNGLHAGVVFGVLAYLAASILGGLASVLLGWGIVHAHAQGFGLGVAVAMWFVQRPS